MTNEPFRVRGWHVLAAMFGFFGAVIAVNVTFAVIAVRSFPGEDVRRSYLQGIHYNDTLAQRRAEAAAGWRATAALTERDGEAVLAVTLESRDGRPLSAATLTGALQRPADASADRPLIFTALGAGHYEARIGALQPGQWRLRARSESETGSLTFESVLLWQS